MSFLNSLYSDKTNNRARATLAAINQTVDEKNYSSLEANCREKISIDSTLQNEAADLLMKLFKAQNSLSMSGLLSGLFGGSRKSTEAESATLWKAFDFLLDSGLSPNVCVGGEHILHVLIGEINSTDIGEKAIRSLVSHGADVNVASKTGQSPLGALLKRERISRDNDASALLDAGAKLNKVDLECWELYKTVFQHGMYRVACQIPNECLAKMARRGEGELTLLHLTAGGLNIGASNDLQSVFNEQYASNGTYPLLAKMLLDCGADVGAKTNRGYDALEIALSTNHMDTYDVLLKHSNDSNSSNFSYGMKHSNGSNSSNFSYRINEVLGGKSTALFQAAYSNNASAVMDLLARGADPNVNSFVNYEQKQLVEPGVPPEVSQLLFQKNISRFANPSDFFRLDFGITNLYYPAMNDYEQVVRLLLEAGEDPNSRSLNGLFPLYVAAENGNLGVVKLLVQYGAQIDLETPKGCTALQNAAEEGMDSVVRYLLSVGANPYHRSKAGDTPLDGAMKYDKYSTARILRDVMQGR